MLSGGMETERPVSGIKWDNDCNYNVQKTPEICFQMRIILIRKKVINKYFKYYIYTYIVLYIYIYSIIYIYIYIYIYVCANFKCVT